MPEGSVNYYKNIRKAKCGIAIQYLNRLQLLNLKKAEEALYLNAVFMEYTLERTSQK